MSAQQEFSPSPDRASDESTAALATLCKAASDPLRIDILRVLSAESFGVQELASILNVPQPGMSHHLKILSKCGLLVTRRQGNSIFYRRALLRDHERLSRLQSSLYSSIDEISLPEDYSQRMTTVYEDRALQSRNYFERNVEKFAENQGMLCELAQYLSNLNELLDVMNLQLKSQVLEVGPGQGLLLDELSRRFDKIVALDNSGEMLNLAKGGSPQRSKKIQFINCSLEDYKLGPQVPFDAVVLNMVLHHMPSPPQAVKKLGEIVQVGGFLVIADLCSHNQEWARGSCGDVWLGFDPRDVDEWAEGSGFKVEQSLYLGLKNGFQIQLKLFRKY
jgi:DNA-binding transcriptional ArsR family regulator